MAELQVREMVEVPKEHEGVPVTQSRYVGGKLADVPVMTTVPEWHTVGPVDDQGHLLVVSLDAPGAAAFLEHAAPHCWHQVDKGVRVIRVQKNSVASADFMRLVTDDE